VVSLSGRPGTWASRRRGRVADFVDRLANRHEGRTRRAFAESLERTVGEVDAPLRRGGAAVPIDRPAVAEAAPLLLQMADRLRAPEPLPAEAMRLVRSLVSDGAGPLYARSAHRSEYPPGTLSRVARAILATCDERVPLREPGELVRI
jgi:hypothetical protein